jgi:hypothetical protein
MVCSFPCLKGCSCFHRPLRVGLGLAARRFLSNAANGRSRISEALPRVSVSHPAMRAGDIPALPGVVSLPFFAQATLLVAVRPMSPDFLAERISSPTRSRPAGFHPETVEKG